MSNDLQSRVMAAKAKFHKYRSPFAGTFGRGLSDFYDVRSMQGILSGFDLIRFDDEVIQSGDAAMCDVIKTKHGDEALAMIQDLIGAPHAA